MPRQWYTPRDNLTISDRALKTFVLVRENVALSAMRIILPDNFLATQQIDRVPFIRVFLLYHTSPLSSPFSRIIYLESIIQRRIETNWQKLLETAPPLILLKLLILYISFFFKLMESLCFFLLIASNILFLYWMLREHAFSRDVKI